MRLTKINTNSVTPFHLAFHCGIVHLVWGFLSREFLCVTCVLSIADFTSSLLLHEVVRMIGLFFESFGLLLHTLLDPFDGFRFVRVLEEMCRMEDMGG